MKLKHYQKIVMIYVRGLKWCLFCKLCNRGKTTPSVLLLSNLPAPSTGTSHTLRMEHSASPTSLHQRGKFLGSALSLTVALMKGI